MSLTGRVLDEQDSSIPASTITWKTSDGQQRTVISNDRGVYRIDGLPLGPVTLIYEAPGMERRTVSVSLQAGENSIDERLHVSPLNSSVIVTAQKRDEELSQTPVSIDLITGKKAEEDGIHELGDLNGDVSNFLYSNAGARGVFSLFIMRGFANNANSVDPSVAFYVDGIPVNDFFTLDQQLIDIDHIEVLKGPQGALYGASSEAGVVNVISKAPTNEYHGSVTGSFASYNGYQTAVSVSGPAVKDKLLFAVSGAVDGRDAFVTGYITQKGINDQFSYSGRTRLDWIPQEHWRISGVIDGSHVADGGSFILIPTDLAQFNQTVFAGLPPLQPYQQPVDTDGSSGLATNSESLQSFYSGSSFNFTALVARREALAHYVQDADVSPVPFYVNNFRFRHPAWNEEFRFQSPDKSHRWIWTAGASFLNDTRHNQDLLNIVPENPYGYPATTLSYGDPLMTSFIPAVFGQVSTRFFHQRLGITGGFREEWLGRSLLRQPNPNGITYNGSIHDSIPLPSFIADYRVKPNIFVYYSLGRGWVPGGQNIYATTLDTALYKRQTSLSNELGVKTTLFRDTLALNADIFHNGVQNYQDTVYAGVLTSYFGNAARAHMNGAEFEAGWQPIRQLKLDANIGLISARYDDYLVNASTGLNLNNQRIHSVPNTTSTLSAQVNPYRGFFVKGEWSEVGSRFEYDLSSAVAAVPSRFGSYAIANLQAGIDRSRWSTLVFANNLTDKLYFPWITVGATPGTGYQGGLGIPGMRRQIGFRTTFRF